MLYGGSRRLYSVGLDPYAQPNCVHMRRSDNMGRYAPPTGKCDAFERPKKRPLFNYWRNCLLGPTLPVAIIVDLEGTNAHCHSERSDESPGEADRCHGWETILSLALDGS